MAKKKEEKTNVMRILDQKKVAYTMRTYEEGDGPMGTSEYGLLIGAHGIGHFFLVQNPHHIGFFFFFLCHRGYLLKNQSGHTAPFPVGV